MTLFCNLFDIDNTFLKTFYFPVCEKYKSLNIKQLEAIPLLPSPDPVRVNVSSCPPTTVPLVVGGKVVTINEFPHMALLGWRRVDVRFFYILLLLLFK